MPQYQTPIKTIRTIFSTSFLRNRCSVKSFRWEPVGGVAAWVWLFKAVLGMEMFGIVVRWNECGLVLYCDGMVCCVTGWLGILLQWYILNTCSYVWFWWPVTYSNESFLCPLLKVLTCHLLCFNPDIVICHVSLFLCPPAPGAHIKLPRFHFKAAALSLDWGFGVIIQTVVSFFTIFTIALLISNCHFNLTRNQVSISTPHHNYTRGSSTKMSLRGRARYVSRDVLWSEQVLSFRWCRQNENMPAVTNPLKIWKYAQKRGCQAAILAANMPPTYPISLCV